MKNWKTWIAIVAAAALVVAGVEKPVSLVDRNEIQLVERIINHLVEAVLKALLEGIAAGDMSREDALYEHIRIREAGKDAILATLNSDQKERFEATRGFTRGRRHRFSH